MGLISGIPETIPSWALIDELKGGYSSSLVNSATGNNSSNIYKDLQTYEDIPQYGTVTLRTDGLIERTGKTKPCYGIVEKAYTAGAIAKVLLLGETNIPNLVIGKKYFLGDSSVTLIPTYNKDEIIQDLGIASSENSLFFNPREAMYVL